MENKIAEYITMTHEEIISIAEEVSGYNDLYLVDAYGVWINSKNEKRTIYDQSKFVEVLESYFNKNVKRVIKETSEFYVLFEWFMHEL